MAAGPRRAVLAIGLATALSMMGDMLLFTVLPTQHAALGISVVALGVLLSVHRFIRLVVNPVVGMMCDRVGRRRPFLAGTALALISTFGYWLADGFWPLLAARLVWGVSFSLLLVSGYSIVLDVTTTADRGRAIGWYQSLIAVGTTAALVASGVLADVVGYRHTLAVFTPVTALAWLTAYLALRETRPESMAHVPSLSWRESYPALDRRLVWPAYVTFAAFFAGNGVLMATLGGHLKAEAGNGGAGTLVVPLATTTGVLLAVRKLASIVAGPVAGALSDRVADRRWIVAVGVTASVAGFAMLAGARGVAAMTVAVVITAVGEGVTLPAVTAWAGDLTPVRLRGVVMGGLVTVNDFGGGVGALVGYAIGAMAGLRPAYALCAVVFVSALAALAVAGPDPRRVHLAEALE